MPRAYLSFDLPKDREELYNAQHGSDYRWMLSDLYGHLRAVSKYENKTSIKIDELREFIRELENKYGVEI